MNAHFTKSLCLCPEKSCRSNSQFRCFKALNDSFHFSWKALHVLSFEIPTKQRRSKHLSKEKSPSDYIRLPSPLFKNESDRSWFQMIKFGNLSVKYRITREYLASHFTVAKRRNPEMISRSIFLRFVRVCGKWMEIPFVCFFAFSSNFI